MKIDVDIDTTIWGRIGACILAVGAALLAPAALARARRRQIPRGTNVLVILNRGAGPEVFTVRYRPSILRDGEHEHTVHTRNIGFEKCYRLTRKMLAGLGYDPSNPEVFDGLSMSAQGQVGARTAGAHRAGRKAA